METQNEEKKPKYTFDKKTFWETVRFVFFAVAIVIPIRIFIAQPFIVSGSSMFPTLENGEYLIVDELTYRLESPERGDVVIFRYPGDTKKFFIKRIIGLPEETVDIEGNVVTIKNKEYPDGFSLNEPYVKNKKESQTHFELKNNEYFVLGDNRSASSDSRYWGTVNRDLLVGRAFLRLLPVNRIDLLPGSYAEKY